MILALHVNKAQLTVVDLVNVLTGGCGLIVQINLPKIQLHYL
jgi:hypothetical protein